MTNLFYSLFYIVNPAHADLPPLAPVAALGADPDIFVNGEMGLGWQKTVYGDELRAMYTYNSSIIKFSDGSAALCNGARAPSHLPYSPGLAANSAQPPLSEHRTRSDVFKASLLFPTPSHSLPAPSNDIRHGFRRP